MIDTVKFILPAIKGVDFLDDVSPCLDDSSQGGDKWGSFVMGHLGNLRVTIRPYQIKVVGSLCKWMLGDNFQTLTRGTIKQALECLNDTLGLPMERAKITRLDVGFSIPVSQPPPNYFNHLGVLNYAQRLQQPNSLYYHRHRGSEVLCFYDKNREQRDHRETIPELYRGSHVLRYEQRYTARLPSLLRVPEVTGAMLYDEQFYNSLLLRWRESYQAINKINDINMNLQAMKTRKDLHTFGILALVEKYGGEVSMMEQFKEAQRRGELTAKQAYDHRQAVKNACKVKDGLSAPNESIHELDELVNMAVKLGTELQ